MHTETAKRPTYKELLLDPRWQKKRLEVLLRDQFRCVECGAARETLHVHHHYYVSGRPPWEYPLESMITVCWECHAHISRNLINFKADWELLFCCGLASASTVSSFCHSFQLWCRATGLSPDDALSELDEALWKIQMEAEPK